MIKYLIVSLGPPAIAVDHMLTRQNRTFSEKCGQKQWRAPIKWGTARVDLSKLQTPIFQVLRTFPPSNYLHTARPESSIYSRPYRHEIQSQSMQVAFASISVY